MEEVFVQGCFQGANGWGEEAGMVVEDSVFMGDGHGNMRWLVASGVVKVDSPKAGAEVLGSLEDKFVVEGNGDTGVVEFGLTTCCCELVHG